MIHTPYNSASPSAPADIMEGITQIMTQVANNNKRHDVSKQMMKNIKIFHGSSKAECITWFGQVEAAARFTNTPFRELIGQSMAPAMLHVFSELSALASDKDIKDAILTNYSYPKHHGSSHMTKEHTNLNQRTLSHIQSQI